MCSPHLCIPVAKSGEMTDSQLKSAIEGVVIKWVHQVEEVLVQDTDSLSSTQHFPKPMEEITFWRRRRENLAHIASQLKDKKVNTSPHISIHLRALLLSTYNKPHF